MFGFLQKMMKQETPREQGRSMVEMLGVLAIIGVLSIGGIAGYTMAMNRHKANQILDMASKLSIATQSARSTAQNNEAWQDAMYSVADELGTRAMSYQYNFDNAVIVFGPYESTYSIWDDGSVNLHVESDQPALRNAIKSIGGTSNIRIDY